MVIRLNMINSILLLSKQALQKIVVSHLGLHCLVSVNFYSCANKKRESDLGPYRLQYSLLLIPYQFLCIFRCY